MSRNANSLAAVVNSNARWTGSRDQRLRHPRRACTSSGKPRCANWAGSNRNHPRAHTLSRRLPRGFTLVELLTVIAVIIVLMALLLPVVGKARRQVQIVSCASNLHQMGVAFSIYANDNDRLYPTPVKTGNYPFGDFGINGFNRPGGPDGFCVLYGANMLPNASNFYCPAANADGSITQSVHWNPPAWGITYCGYCSWAAYRSIFDGPNLLPALVADSPKSPGTRLLVSDLVSVYHTGGGAQTNAYTNHLSNQDQPDGGNALYNDGSVHWLYFSSMRKLLSVSGDGGATSIDFYY